MTTPPDKTEELLQAIEALQKSFDRTDEASDARLDALEDYVKALRGQVDAQEGLVNSVSDVKVASTDVMDVLIEGINDLTPRMDAMGITLGGIRNDLGEARGGHARSAMLRNAALVADALDCRLISEVPQGVLLGLSKMASASGESPNDVESFRNADMVIYVSDAQGRPRYIAVEASFTVDDRDVSRAVRNAGYLQKYTGLPSDAVVAGVEVLQDAQDRIDQGEARLYHIQRRELQSE